MAPSNGCAFKKDCDCDSKRWKKFERFCSRHLRRIKSKLFRDYDAIASIASIARFSRLLPTSSSILDRTHHQIYRPSRSSSSFPEIGLVDLVEEECRASGFWIPSTDNQSARSLAFVIRFIPVPYCTVHVRYGLWVLCCFYGTTYGTVRYSAK
jgi:hypothetical protein